MKKTEERYIWRNYVHGSRTAKEQNPPSHRWNVNRMLWFCSKLYIIEAIADDADMDLFCKTANPRHCVHSLLSPVKNL